MKPICVPCERFMRPKHNGYRFLEGMPTMCGADPAKNIGRSAVGWQPSKLWIGDLWHCPDCGAEIVVGVAHRPLAEHYEPTFQHSVELATGRNLRHASPAKPLLLVKDC